MKRALATTLSIAGVLAAGASAYAVNTSVLGGSAGNGSAQAAAPADTVAELTGSVGARDTAQRVSEAQATPTPVDESTTTYQVGDAGSVVLSTASGSIEVVSIMPAAGWAAEPSMTHADGSVKVHFYSASTRLEFRATMTNGSVSVSVTTDLMDQPGAPAAPKSHVDDDDDDSRENHHRDRDGDHEDDESEQEDDD